MSDRDLSNFLKKIEQLNQIAELIKNNPSKKLSLSKCKNHDDVIKGFTIVGNFLDKSILKPNNLNFPINRIEFVNSIK